MAARLALVAAWLGAAAGCLSTVAQRGTLADSELLQPPLNTTAGCECCALCHQQPECASHSFSAASGTCRLYRSVPDFRRLQLDEQSALFVQPGRSQHQQFCRLDTDCVQPGDACHGRLCTSDTTVTCRDLAETHGATGSGLFYGSVGGRTTKFYCRELADLAGWTLIGMFRQG